MSLALVHARQVACWPWDLRWVCGGGVRAATCRTCERDVAQPIGRTSEVPVCIYCGLDSGLVEAVDEPFDAPFPFGEKRS